MGERLWFQQETGPRGQEFLPRFSGLRQSSGRCLLTRFCYGLRGFVPVRGPGLIRHTPVERQQRAVVCGSGVCRLGAGDVYPVIGSGYIPEV